MKTRNISDRTINVFLIISLVIANCMELPYIMYQYFTPVTLTLLLVTEFLIYITHIVLCIRDRKRRVLYRLILIMDGIVFAGCMINALLRPIYPDGLPLILAIPFGLAAVTCSPCFSLTVNLLELPGYIRYISPMAGINDPSFLIHVFSVLRWVLLILIIAGWLAAVNSCKKKDSNAEAIQ